MIRTGKTTFLLLQRAENTIKSAHIMWAFFMVPPTGFEPVFYG